MSEGAAVPQSAMVGRTRWWGWRVLGTVLAIKVLVFVYGILSYLTPWQSVLRSLDDLAQIWNRWDSLNYLWIAEDGYAPTGDAARLIVFYPLYPALIRLLAPACGGYLRAALLISTVASFAVGLLLHRLVWLDTPQDADRTVFFLFVFPTSYVLHIGYSESLFLALALTSILCARTGRWAWAGVFGACTGLTRVTALALVPALVLEAFGQYRRDRRWRWSWLFAGTAFIGLAGYLLVNVLVTGDAFTFVQYQQNYFDRIPDAPWRGVLNLWRSLFVPQTAAVWVSRSAELLFSGLGIVAMVVAWSELRSADAAWTTASVVLFLSFKLPASVPRYALLLYPVFILSARLGRRPFWFALLSVGSLLLLALFCGLYVRGFWAF